MLNSKHHIQLGPDDSVSFPVVYGGAKQNMLWFFVNSNFWSYRKKENTKLNEVDLCNFVI